jgi:glycosyltransferase involved in cell wall biosynthesis
VRISIVTAVRNGAATVEETIRSVLDQADAEVEYIVVDGGSTDGTVEVIRRHESRIARWVSEPDEGISDAFNKGIALATGEVVGIISADDGLWPGAIAAVREAFARHPTADVVYGNAVFLEPGGRSVVSRPERDFRYVHLRSPLRHAAVFVRRDAYARYGGFDRGYRLAMDYDLILRFHLAGARFVYTDAPLAWIRAGGVSARNFRRTIAETRAISIAHGTGAPAAYAMAWAQVAKTLVKGALQRPGLRWILELYRSRSPRFDPMSGDR